MAAISQPPYTLYSVLAPADFFLLSKEKSSLKGHYIMWPWAMSSVKKASMRSFKDFRLPVVFESWKRCWQKCVNAQGMYVLWKIWRFCINIYNKNDFSVFSPRLFLYTCVSCVHHIVYCVYHLCITCVSCVYDLCIMCLCCEQWIRGLLKYLLLPALHFSWVGCVALLTICGITRNWNKLYVGGIEWMILLMVIQPRFNVLCNWSKLGALK